MSVGMSVGMSAEFYSALLTHFEGLEQELNKLDAATGDGDHGTTIVKGLRAIVADQSDAPVAPVAPAKKFRRAAGGASGSLFAQIIGAFDQILQQENDLSTSLQNAADRIAQLGQAVAGDKTMLDALIPAAKAQTIETVVSAAMQGADSTIDMTARRGRARYVENGGVGHKDAGATSVAEMLSVFSQYYLSQESD